ncbi:homeodomain transcriptional regulator, partial [Trifolium medium]|nr:homeodomain transcriptional regulator [Trifolium medium]
SGGNDDALQKNPFVDVTLDIQSGANQVTPIDGPLVPSDRRVIHEEELSRLQRKRKRLECNGNLKCKRKELEKSL